MVNVEIDHFGSDDDITTNTPPNTLTTSSPNSRWVTLQVSAPVLGYVISLRYASNDPGEYIASYATGLEQDELWAAGKRN